MESEDVISLLLSRRTVRHFEGGPVDRATLDLLIEAARWAPSGLNNQPWRFITVESAEGVAKLAALTKYGKIISDAGAAIAVFLDTAAVYNRTKDVQSIGAALQNILLAAHGMGLGACWLGEIVNRREEVEKALAAPEGLELMAVVVVGRPRAGAKEGSRERIMLEKLIVGRR